MVFCALPGSKTFSFSRSISLSLASTETFLNCHSVPMWLFGLWLMSSVMFKICSPGLAATRWPFSWKGGRRDGGRFSGDDVRSSEAAVLPLAISWTSNMPSFTLMRVWGQCQTGRDTLHSLVFKAHGWIEVHTGEQVCFPTFELVAHIAVFRQKKKKNETSVKQPACFHNLVLHNLFNVQQEYKSHIGTLCRNTCVHPKNIHLQLSNVLQDTCTSHNLNFIKDQKQQYSGYLHAKKNLALHFPVYIRNLQASWRLIAAPYLHRCRRCLLSLRNKLLSGLSAHCGFTAGAVRCWLFFHWYIFIV